MLSKFIKLKRLVCGLAESLTFVFKPNTITHESLNCLGIGVSQMNHGMVLGENPRSKKV